MNVFRRSIVHNSYFAAALRWEFAEGNSLPLERVPFTFDPPRVGSDRAIFTKSFKTARKVAIRPVEGDRLLGFYSHLSSSPSRTAAVD